MICRFARILTILLNGYHERFGQAGKWRVVFHDDSATLPITLGCALLMASITPGRIARHRSAGEAP